MLSSLNKICKEYNLKDDEVIKLARRLYDNPVFSAKISAVMIVCRLNRCKSSRILEGFVVVLVVVCCDVLGLAVDRSFEGSVEGEVDTLGLSLGCLDLDLINLLPEQ